MSALHTFLSRSFWRRCLTWCGAIFAFAVLVFTSDVSTVSAANGINRQINYQAKLSDALGFPVADGTYNFKFSLYSSATGGLAIWTASGTTASPLPLTVNISNGLFTVMLGDTSSTAGSQNPLNDAVAWNSDNLYLGVTVGTDAEMSPRKRLAAAPYAFNAERLQGMYASGTAFGANSLFSVNQVSNTAATGTRTALEVRSAGTSDANDFLIRGVNDLGSDVLSVNRQGNVTSTGLLAVTGNGTSTFMGAVSSTGGVFDRYLTVRGQSVCLADGTNCASASSADTFASVTARGAVATTTLSIFGGASISFLNVTSTFGVSSTASFEGDVLLGNAPTDVITPTGRFNGDILPSSDQGYALGSTTSRWDAYFSSATATNQFTSVIASNSTFTSVSSVVLESLANVRQGRVVGNILYVIAGGGVSALYAFDISQPEQPRRLGSLAFGSELTYFDVQGRYAYIVTTGASLHVVDLKNPASMSLVATTSIFGFGNGIHVAGKYAYIIDDIRFRVYDISNPANPYQISQSGLYTNLNSLDVRGKYAYVFESSGSRNFRVFDVSNPNAVAEVGSVPLGGTNAGMGIIARDGYAFLSTNSSHLFTINITDPTAPYVQTTSTGVFANDGTGRGFASIGDYLIGKSALLSMRVMDVSDPTAPTSVRTFATTAFNPRSPIVAGNYLYVFDGSSVSANFNVIRLPGMRAATLEAGSVLTEGLQVIDSARFGNNVDILSGLSVYDGIRSFGALSVYAPSVTSTFFGDVSVFGTVSTTNLFVSDQRVCLENGSNCPTSGGSDSNWSYSASGNFLRMVTSTNDLVLGNTGTSTGAAAYFDLSGSTGGTSTVYLGFATNTNVVLGGTSTTQTGLHSNFVMDGNDLFVNGNIGSASSVYTNGAFVAGTGTTRFSDGLISKTNGILTITTTSGTRVQNSLDNTLDVAHTMGQVTSTHLSQLSMQNVIVRGRYAYVYHDTGYFSVLDVSDVSNPSLLSTTYIGASAAYNSMDVSGNYLYYYDYTRLQIFDLSNPRNPRLVGAVSGLTSNGEIKVVGAFAYIVSVGNYFVINVADPANPFVAGALGSGVGAGEQSVQNGYAYVAGDFGNTFNVVDVRNPAKPTMAYSSTTIAQTPNSLVTQGRYAYMAYHDNGAIDIIDIASSTSPFTVKRFATGEANLGSKNVLSIQGRYLYVLGDFNLRVFDVSSSTNPTLVNTSANFGVNAFANGIAVSGRYAYIGLTSPTNVLIYDVLGTETNGLQAASAEFGSITVRTDAVIAGRADLLGGLSVGLSGIRSDGALSVNAYGATSTFKGDVTVFGAVSTTSLYVNSQSVCLANGTNCPVSGSSGTSTVDFNWRYTAAGNFVRQATTTSDLLLGGTNTSTGGAVLFDVSADGSSNSNVYVGYKAQANVLIGGTSTTEFGLNSAFTVDGNDLFVNGNIGSVSSVYTNGEFVAGVGSTRFGDGYIRKNDGNLLFDVSGGYMVPATDLGISLGSSSYRFNGDFGSVTSAVLTVTGSATTSYVGAVSTTRLNTNVLSSSNAGPLLVTAASGTQFVNAIENNLSANSRLPEVYTLTPSSFSVGEWQFQGSYAYIHNNTYQTLHVLDFANPARPVEVLNQAWPQDMTDIAVSGDFLYAVGNRINVFDLKHPGSATLVHQSASGLGGDAVRVNGRNLYVANRASGKVRIFDLKNPVVPALIGTYDLTQANRLEVFDNWVFVGSDATSSINIINVKDPANPVLYAATRTNEGINAGAFSVENGRLYVASQGTDASVWVYDLSKLPFRQIAKFNTNSYNTSKQPFHTNDKYLFYSNALGQVEIWDIGATNTATQVRALGGVGGGPVMQVGRYLYAAENDHVHVIDLGGIETSALLAHSASLGDLTVGGSAYVGNTLIVRSGAWFGTQGVNSVGGLSGSFMNLSATGTTSTIAGNLEVLGVVSTTQFTVNSQLVCLANGTNCPAASAPDWVYAATGDFLRTSTGTTNLLIGGTSTTDTGLNSQFVINGNDLFVNGNIGSVSSVYTNGAFVAGTGTTMYAAGSLTNTVGTYAIHSASGTRFSGALLQDYTSQTKFRIATTTDEGGISGYHDVKISGRYAYAVANGLLKIWDIGNIGSPSSVGAITGLNGPYDVEIQGNYAYVQTSGGSLGIRIFDISNPASIVEVGHTGAFPGGFEPSYSVEVQGRYAYTTFGGILTGKLAVVDIADPTSPTSVAFVSLASPSTVKVEGRYAYVSTDSGTAIHLIDLRDPLHPVDVATISGFANVASFAVSDKNLFVTESAIAEELFVYDVSNATAPSLIANIDASPNAPVMVKRVGKYLMQMSTTNMSIIDVSNPRSPTTTASVDLSDLGGNAAFAISGNKMVVAYDSSAKKLGFVELPGLEASTLAVGSAEVGGLNVLEDASIWNSLSVGNALGVGLGGISSFGSLSVYSTNTTSSIMGNLMVGTSTMQAAMHNLFTLDGDDLFVGGNIGSASSVFTSGEFIAGTGTTRYGDSMVSASGTSLFQFNSHNQTGLGTSFLFKTNSNIQNPIAIFSFSPTGYASYVDYNGSFVVGSSTSYGLSGIQSSQTAYQVTNNIGSITFSASSGTYINNLQSGFGTPRILGQTTSTIADGPTSLEIYNGFAYIGHQNTQRLDIVEIQDKNNPSEATNIPLPYFPRKLRQLGSRFFIMADDSITIADSPHFIRSGKIDGLTSPQDVAIIGRYMYVADGDAIKTYDVANLGHIQLLSTVASTGTRQIVSQAERLYLLSADTLRVYNTQGVDPEFMYEYTIPHGPATLEVQGTHAYVGRTSATTGLVLHVGSTTSSRLVGSFSCAPAACQGVHLAGKYLYVQRTGYGGGFTAFDIQDPASPAQQTFANPLTSDYTIDLEVSGRYLYAIQSHDMGGATGTSTLSIIDMGGIEVSGMTAHALDVGRLDVQGDATFEKNVGVSGALFAERGLASHGPVSAVVSSTSSTARFINSGNTRSGGTAWGAYINRLLVGDHENTTGTNDFAMVLSYEGARDGLCLTQATHFCPTVSSTTVSITADDTISANAFDIAEEYALNGTATATDLLVMSTSTSRAVEKSDGTPYDSRLVGVYSTKPGFLLGGGTFGTPVALSGRVPLKVSVVNGAIAAGDPLTSSPYAGYAMKATRPGMIVGYALDATSTTSTIEVFVKVGYDAKMALGTNAGGTITQVMDDLVFAATSTASVASPVVDSWGLTFRGSAWNGASAMSEDYRLFTDILSATSSQFAIQNNSSTNIFTINKSGSAQLTGDLHIGGKLYPSGRGTLQSSKYIYLDDSAGPTTTYMATNADGWQANSSYDFAERYYSPDALEPGDLVVVSRTGELHVQRSLDAATMLAGIVSTKPGFVTGAPATSTYPIALSGRVPTKVSTVKGSIVTGDPLAPSTIPGVAVKATEPGPIVGYALQDYAQTGVGKIEVFVNPVWWGGDLAKLVQDAASAATAVNGSNAAGNTASGKAAQGLAVMKAGGKQLRVSYASINAYPNVQVTPRGEVVGSWWTDGYSDTGFDIVLKQAQDRDVTFTWRVEATVAGEDLFYSDGTASKVDALLGTPQTGTQTNVVTATTTEAVATPAPEAPPSTEVQGPIPTPDLVPVSTETATDPAMVTAP